MTHDPSKPARDAAGRFKTGTSGNTRGRPRKTTEREPSPLEMAFDRLVPVTVDGDRSEIGLEEAIDLKTFDDAMAGKARAIQKITGWVKKRETWRQKAHEKDHPRKIEWRFSEDPENAVGALQILGIATRDWEYDPSDTDTVRLQLEHWAVEAALQRRRGGKFSKEEIRDIERCTRDEERIAWPKGSRDD